MNDTTARAPANLWRSREFQSYLGSTAFTGVAFSMQQLLISWMLVGILLLPAGRVGATQAIIGIPGIFLMLWGGATADRVDPRGLLIGAYAIAWVIPIGLAISIKSALLNMWMVMAFGLAMSTIISFSNPAAQSILNRVAGGEVQRAVTASTAISFMMQIVGLTLAGQMERLGLPTVLLIQGACLLASAIAVRRISAQAPENTRHRGPTLQVIADGLAATWANRTICHTLLINILSSIFNAGAFTTVLPFVIKRVYQGDALNLATVMVVFYAGAMVSNFLMLRVMPFERPGRVYLVMQLSRVVIVALLWTSPPWWILVGVLLAWGLNMGVTSTLARTIVQESAAPQYRGRILSIFSLGQMGSAPIGAIVLGLIIEAFGTLNALIPSMIVSTLLFLAGMLLSDVWRYRSPQFERQ